MDRLQHLSRKDRGVFSNGTEHLPRVNLGILESLNGHDMVLRSFPMHIRYNNWT